MQENKQTEKIVHYEQKPDKDKPDYTPQRTYEPQSINGRETSDRRSFLRRTGTAVVVGLGGILFGKTAMADGIDGVVGDHEEGSRKGSKRVTNGYDRSGKDNYEEIKCDPLGGSRRSDEYNPNAECYPCDPDCEPNCHLECGPHSENNSDFKKVTGDYDRRSKEKLGVISGCDPGCRPDCIPPAPCGPNCSPPPEPCDPNCTP